jgi:cell wall-associated NlpC family hydrolase
MKKLVLLFLVTFVSIVSFAQQRQLDQLDLLYKQQHIRMVFRKANRLIDSPEFDFSLTPKFYKAITALELSKNKFWLMRHDNVLDETKAILTSINSSNEGKVLITKNLTELGKLKARLHKQLNFYKLEKNELKYNELKDAMGTFFDAIKTIETIEKIPSKKENELYNAERNQLISVAKNYIGTPYVFAGTDENGFDCSGYTCYVMKKNGINLPRTAAEQFEAAKKIKQSEVQKGDLIFFDSGTGVSHVGIILSEKNEPLVMIHASTSKGVVITEIEKSDYWLKKIAGFGTFVN